MFTLLRITTDFAPVEFSPTHCPHTDSDFSLKDFPPASSETVLPHLPLPPSPVFVFSSLFPIFGRGGNRSTHYPGKWVVSVCPRTDHPVQPLLYLSISKPYQLSSIISRPSNCQQLCYKLVDITDGLINSWLIQRVPENVSPPEFSASSFFPFRTVWD